MSSKYKPIERTAIDGKTWWYPYDTDKKEFSTLMTHYKCKTKKECQQLINKTEAKELFTQIYPEKFIRSYVSPIDSENCLIEGHFPDGVFYFVANENCLSQAYDTKEEAISDIQKEAKTKTVERE